MMDIVNNSAKDLENYQENQNHEAYKAEGVNSTAWIALGFTADRVEAIFTDSTRKAMATFGTATDGTSFTCVSRAALIRSVFSIRIRNDVEACFLPRNGSVERALHTVLARKACTGFFWAV